MGRGKTVSQAAKDAGITDQTFYRWRKEYGGLQIEQAKKLKDLQKENTQLRRAIADLTVEKQILKDIAEGNSTSRAASPRGTQHDQPTQRDDEDRITRPSSRWPL